MVLGLKKEAAHPPLPRLSLGAGAHPALVPQTRARPWGTEAQGRGPPATLPGPPPAQTAHGRGTNTLFPQLCWSGSSKGSWADLGAEGRLCCDCAHRQIWGWGRPRGHLAPVPL